MTQCECLTVKGQRCKLTVEPGKHYCWMHKNCAHNFEEPVSSSSTSSRSSLGSLRNQSGSILMPRKKVNSPVKTTSNDKIDLGLVRIPTPLISRITEDITDQVQAGVPANIATVRTLDDIAEELGYDDVANLVDLTEDEIDYFISTILLHENKDKLADIVQQKIDQQKIKDPHGKLVLKTRELLAELSAKFCRCIQKVLESDRPANGGPMTENVATAICRKGVINSRGITFPRFSCKTYTDPSDKSKYLDTPIFLPSKEHKKLLRRHPAYQLYLSEVGDGDLTKWSQLKAAQKDQYYKRAKI